MSKQITITIPLRAVGIFVLSLLLLGLVAPVIAPVLIPGIEPHMQVLINPVFASPDTDTFYVGGVDEVNI